MTFRVIVAQAAEEDLSRLNDHLLGRAEYVEDLEVAGRALDAIRNAMTSLAMTPFIFRKVDEWGRLVAPRAHRALRQFRLRRSIRNRRA